MNSVLKRNSGEDRYMYSLVLGFILGYSSRGVGG